MRRQSNCGASSWLQAQRHARLQPCNAVVWKGCFIPYGELSITAAGVMKLCQWSDAGISLLEFLNNVGASAVCSSLHGCAMQFTAHLWLMIRGPHACKGWEAPRYCLPCKTPGKPEIHHFLKQRLRLRGFACNTSR